MSKSVFMTGVAIANSMVGSSMILFPLKFNQYGIGINVIFVVPARPARSSWPPSCR